MFMPLLVGIFLGTFLKQNIGFHDVETFEEHYVKSTKAW